MSYGLLYIPSDEITAKYGIASSFCNLAIGDHDLTRFHLTDSFEFIQDCQKYYMTKWPRETYKIVTVESYE